MEDDQTPPTEEELKAFYGRLPKPRKPFSYKSFDLDVEMPKCESISGTRQYMGLDATIPVEDCDKILDQLETYMSCERQGDISYFNDTLVAQATLFDLALRYYYGGGETKKVNDKDFTLAVNACDMSLRVIREARKARRDERLDEMRGEDLRRKDIAERRKGRGVFVNVD